MLEDIQSPRPLDGSHQENGMMKPSNSQMRKLRKAAEAKLADGARVSRTADATLHELRVHEIELEMQNESLRQIQAELETALERYQDLYNFAPAGYCTLNREGQITEYNLTLREMLGKPRSMLEGRPFASLVVVDDADRWHLYFQTTLRDGTAQVLELELAHQDGSTLPVRLESLCILSGSRVTALRIAISDISERRRIEQEQRIAAIAFEAQQPMLVTDTTGTIVRVNRAFSEVSGYAAEEAVGRTLALLESERHDAAFQQQMFATLQEHGRWQGTVWNRYKNGMIYAAWLTMAAVRASGGRISHYVGTYSDVSRNLEAEAEIHRLAYYDPLTHLPNRRLLLDRLGQSLAGSARHGRLGAVLCLDLDRFKDLNDAHGHDVGDSLLISVAKRLEAIKRRGDTVARLSGDEFALVLDELSGNAEEAAVQARLVAGKVREALSRPYDLDGLEYACTTSFGIALFNGDCGIRVLLKQADLALYQAKKAGRNIVGFYDAQMQAKVDAHAALENELRNALTQQKFRLYYQPQVDHAQRVVGVEALLRLLHPQRGLLEPSAFIALAEETGLIVPIGRWVLETACKQIKAWSQRAGTARLKVSVNVSARQFHQADFVAEVQEVLSSSGADPELLTLELTESSAISDLPDTIAKMHALKALGVSFAMDDFGTGYSSLSMLSSLPLDQLKIDQTFIHNLSAHRNTDNNTIITQSMIALGQMLGLEVIAEGVETDSQFDLLERLGCPGFQGFLFGRPLAIEVLSMSLH
jgi:diguanylate cyclase (GGDEF)-like protein/PAS domain S-box-containing protein